MLSTISSRAPLGIAAAVIILAVVVGASYMNRNEQSGVGNAPATSPAPVASPVPSASARAESPLATPGLVTLPQAPQASCPGITEQLMCLKPGTYQLGAAGLWPAIVTLEVPANWWYYSGGTGHSGVLVQTEDVTNGSGWGVTFNTVGSVSRDPCDPTAGTFDADVHTPGELFEVMKQWPGFKATEPVPIQNGYTGVRFTLTSTVNIADCGNSVMWTTASGTALDAYPMVNAQGRPLPVDFQIFDIDGDPLVIAAMNFPETSPWEEENGHPFDAGAHAEHQVDMDAILDSIRLKDPQGLSF